MKLPPNKLPGATWQRCHLFCFAKVAVAKSASSWRNFSGAKRVSNLMIKTGAIFLFLLFHNQALGEPNPPCLRKDIPLAVKLPIYRAIANSIFAATLIETPSEGNPVSLRLTKLWKGDEPENPKLHLRTEITLEADKEYLFYLVRYSTDTNQNEYNYDSCADRIVDTESGSEELDLLGDPVKTYAEVQ